MDIKAQVCNLKSKLEDTCHELTSLRETNSELVRQLENNNTLLANLNTENMLLKEELQKKQTEKTSVPPVLPANTLPRLVIGDSLVRDLHSDDQSKLMIRTFPGAKMNVIKEKLSLFARDNKKFSHIYIVAGTNNCALSNYTTDMILEDTQQTLECAAKLSNTVTLSSILPRTDNSSAQLKLENTNLRLKDMCIRMPKVKFVDNDSKFRLADKTPNDALLEADGLHLNHQGSLHLIKNLGITASVRKRQQFISRKFPQPSKTQGFQQKELPVSRPQPTGRSGTFGQNYQPQQYVPVTNPQPSHQVYYPQQQSRFQNNPNSQYIANQFPAVSNFYQPVSCRRCGRSHYTETCQVDPSVICFSCGAIGHTSNACGNYYHS